MRELSLNVFDRSGRLMVFVPALWVFSYFVSPTIGAAVGVVFLIIESRLHAT